MTPNMMPPGAPSGQATSPQASNQEGQQAAISQMGGKQLAPAPNAPQAITPQGPVQEAAPKPADPIDKLRALTESTNLAEDMSEDQLRDIGNACLRGFEEDKSSRTEWERDILEWLKLATQVREDKNYPWPGAANVKYPLMGIAAMQFSARAYPSLVPANGQIVSAKVYGKDPDGSLNERATRVSKYMSYQLAVEMEDWEEDMDRLLMQLSVVGNMYKKTWFDPAIDNIRSESISAVDLVVNYWARSIEKAERISHVFRLYKRQVENLKRQGYYLKKAEILNPTDVEGGFQDQEKTTSSDIKVTPYEIIEQHCYLDLDDDGYEVPVIVTFERKSASVLRIVARFDASKTRVNSKGKVVYIEPHQYFTKFGFIPNPDGSFYDLGFGHLLGPLNEAVNTLTNQLTDAGTLNNLQSGFMGKGLRVKGGEYNFKPGEWKFVNGVIDDLKKQILPIPTKEPSQTLLKLLEMLINSGKELASVAEIFTGKMPGQNTPATTTMAGIEQGMKVFTAIYKRVYKSMNKEFRKIFSLNKVYMNKNTMAPVLDTAIGPNDFDDSVMQIVPTADPSASSQQQKLSLAQGLMEILPLGVTDPVETVKRYLIATEQPDWEKLIPGLAETGQPAPKPEEPNPEAIAAQAKQQEASMKQQQMALKAQTDEASGKQKVQAQAQSDELKMRSQEVQNAMKQQAMAQDLAHQREKQALDLEGQKQKQAIFASAERDKAKKEKAKGAKKS
ncbi:hypothetical protein [uncultured Paraglaciecola sp.]|uniref:hypothetical protein n=1 Tax=uncultured Paraglaciecola sp. TaxID=1765024 RepID=UPI00260F2F0A|nr:hypothetical protein [uncultured Paraglaciecola sp.]